MDAYPQTAVLFEEDVNEAGEQDEDQGHGLEDDGDNGLSLSLNSTHERTVHVIRHLLQSAVCHRHPMPPSILCASFHGLSSQTRGEIAFVGLNGGNRANAADRVTCWCPREAVPSIPLHRTKFARLLIQVFWKTCLLEQRIG